MKKKILIMYATYGTGHKSIANYIEDYFNKKNEYEIKKIDILDCSSRFIGKFTDKFYNRIMFSFPALWDIIYKSTNNKVAGPVSAKLQAKSINEEKLKKIVLDFNPDLVIATHFTAATLISKLKKSGQTNTKLISIVTDYKAHRIWLDSYKSEDALIVNSVEEKKTLTKMGINSKIIKTFGIPVSDKFSIDLYDKIKLMKKFNLKGDRPVVLFYGGGGNGSTVTLPYLISILELDIDYDLFFVCGKNQELKRKAEYLVRKYNKKNVRVLGFITNGPEYLTVSDFIITKPGGITVTECLCFKKPMLLIKSAGGQEKDNYKYLTKNGYAVKASLIFKFKYMFKKLCDNPNLLDEMNSNLKKLNKNNAMQKLDELVFSLINK